MSNSYIKLPEGKSSLYGRCSIAMLVSAGGSWIFSEHRGLTQLLSWYCRWIWLWFRHRLEICQPTTVSRKNNFPIHPIPYAPWQTFPIGIGGKCWSIFQHHEAIAGEHHLLHLGSWSFPGACYCRWTRPWNPMRPNDDHDLMKFNLNHEK